ncbi:feruloyl-CoA synthetase [Mycobacterium sp. GA-1841]|uniref:class I adenylate-forming enzyme family protein n=1 Tax=Mycobacterium sp. GA-1841 TaxID=1834154 RepID=UPI00096E3E19|nr:class I adenylate-forming enzyme family protein [Mycobacterium sp. GA-1841]OMC41373.1 feruloyl-CoA synthetase [Mycobacterium sp. GA-1841]
MTGIPYGRRLTELARDRSAEVALIFIARDGTVTPVSWQQLEGDANATGRALQASGVAAGSFVALSIPNSVQLITTALAAWKIGAVPIPMRWDLPEWERDRLLEVITPAFVLDSASAPDLEALAAEQSQEALPTLISPAENGICSSGSTGLPKIILNTAPAVWTPASSEPFMTHWAPVRRPQTILVPAPMYHTNGFIPLRFLLGGDLLVVLERFDAGTFLEAVEQHRVTTFTATPTMLSRLADSPDIGSRDLSSIEWILQGAAVMPPTVLRRWFDLLSPERVVLSYGMTENLGLTALRGDDWQHHPGSVGRGFRGTEIKILDEAGAELPAGSVGDIYLRAPITGRYRYLGGAPQLPTTADGFTSAGDLGHLDADGYLYIADRRTDMIVTGGANVYPAEIESALIGHPNIADVVVIGLTDPRWGRRVHAVVQIATELDSPSEQEVIDFARTRLAPYKVPKTVEFVDEIPRTAATKVNRAALVRARGG